MKSPRELERVILEFVKTPEWASVEESDPPEDSLEWREGYEAAQQSLRESLKPWWPFGGPLDLGATAAGRAGATGE